MHKAIVAVTNIKHGLSIPNPDDPDNPSHRTYLFAAGQEINTEVFTKAQLEYLAKNGRIKLDVVYDPEEQTDLDEALQNSDTRGDDVEDEQ